jgi:hypothetical protein
MIGSTTSTTTTASTTTGELLSSKIWARPAALGLAGVLAAVPLAVAPTAGTTHAYNSGVKSLHFSAAAETCTPDQALPCSLGAGEGEANVMRVSQSVVDGYHQFTDIDGTSHHDDHLWIAANIGAECRRSHDIIGVEVSDVINDPDDWVVVANSFGIGGSDDVFPTAVPHPDARVMPTKRIAVNVPLSTAFSSDLVAWFPSQDSVLEAGEAEIDRRVAEDGMTYAEARALPYELNTVIRLAATVYCDLPGLAAPRAKRVDADIPLRIEYLPVEGAAPTGLEPGPSDVTAPAQVTDVGLTIVEDPADPCTLHLSGTIHTNAPVEVEYRWVNLYGFYSATHTIVIDHTQQAFVSQEIEVPAAPLVAEGGQLHGDGSIGDKVADVDDAMYSGVFELEVLSPNPVAAVDGFSVPYCFSGPQR